jgi:glycosyltransferase involved in cell wall biosynthesis
MNISIIIPCYNEEGSIEKVIKSLPREVKEIIVVDNNSTDQTSDIANKNNARVILEKKQGYGAAIKAGFMAASGDILVVIDGDEQYPVSNIIDFAKHVEDGEVDFISCCRLPLTNKRVMSWTRRIGNSFLTTITNLLFGTNIKDSQSGMWIFRKDILKEINPSDDDMPFSEEIKIKVIKSNKFKFTERHIDYYSRGGESKLFPIKHGLKNLFFLFKLRLVINKKD